MVFRVQAEWMYSVSLGLVSSSHLGDFVDTATFEVGLSASVLRVGVMWGGPSNSNVMLDVYFFSGEPEMSAGRHRN
jgi:hypothetical protein